MSGLDLLWPTTASDKDVHDGGLLVVNLARKALLLEPLEQWPVGSFGSVTHPIACALPGTRLWGDRESGVTIEFPTEQEAQAVWEVWRHHGTGPKPRAAIPQTATGYPKGWLMGIPLVLAEFDQRFEAERWPFLVVSPEAAHPIHSPCRCSRGVAGCLRDSGERGPVCYPCWRSKREGAQCLH